MGTQDSLSMEDWLRCVIQSGRVDIIEKLLKAGADIEAKDLYGKTFLHFAAIQGKVDVIEVLLKAGANIEAKALSYKTPLHFAAEEGKVAAIEVLIKAGANIEAKDSYSKTPLYLAAEKGKVDAIEVLLKAGANIEAKNHYHNTPLHFAAEEGKVDVIEALLKAGANTEPKFYGYYKPLHFAVVRGKVAAIEVLVKAGANIEAKDYDCKTPLHYAVLLDDGAEEAVAALLQVSSENISKLVADSGLSLKELFEKSEKFESTGEEEIAGAKILTTYKIQQQVNSLSNNWIKSMLNGEYREDFLEKIVLIKKNVKDWELDINNKGQLNKMCELAFGDTESIPTLRFLSACIALENGFKENKLLSDDIVLSKFIGPFTHTKLGLCLDIISSQNEYAEDYMRDGYCQAMQKLLGENTFFTAL